MLSIKTLGFIVTDLTVTSILVGAGALPIIMCLNAMPDGDNTHTDELLPLHFFSTAIVARPSGRARVCVLTYLGLKYVILAPTREVSQMMASMTGLEFLGAIWFIFSSFHGDRFEVL